MGVLRLGHLELCVTDLDETLDHYTKVVGLREMDRQGDRVYLRCFDEYDHHSLILRKHDEAGMAYAAFKVESAEDLNHYEAALRADGLKVERLPAGSQYKKGEAVRFRLPTGQLIELYDFMEQPGREVGHLNPDPWPKDKVGIFPTHLDHILLGGLDVRENIRIFREILGFHLSEQVMGPDGKTMVGAFLFKTSTAHDVAFLNASEENTMSHFTYWLENKSDIIDAGDILGLNGVPIEAGPDRHGITRGLTIYFRDPCGHRNEVFTSSYLAQSDMPPVTWTVEELAPGKKGVFCMTRGGFPETFTTEHSKCF